MGNSAFQEHGMPEEPRMTSPLRGTGCEQLLVRVGSSLGASQCKRSPG